MCINSVKVSASSYYLSNKVHWVNRVTRGCLLRGSVMYTLFCHCHWRLWDDDLLQSVLCTKLAVQICRWFASWSASGDSVTNLQRPYWRRSRFLWKSTWFVEFDSESPMSGWARTYLKFIKRPKLTHSTRSTFLDATTAVIATTDVKTTSSWSAISTSQLTL